MGCPLNGGGNKTFGKKLNPWSVGIFGTHI